MAGAREGAHHGPEEARLSELGPKLPRSPSPRVASIVSEDLPPVRPEAALDIRPAIWWRPKVLVEAEGHPRIHVISH